MTNKHSQIICDNCDNILNDGRSILPGYITLGINTVTEHFSDDPNNQYDLTPNDPHLDVMRNRIQFMREEVKGSPFDIDGDFCNSHCIGSFIDKSMRLQNRRERDNELVSHLCDKCGARIDSQLHSMHTNPVTQEADVILDKS